MSRTPTPAAETCRTTSSAPRSSSAFASPPKRRRTSCSGQYGGHETLDRGRRALPERTPERRLALEVPYGTRFQPQPWTRTTRPRWWFRGRAGVVVALRQFRAGISLRTRSLGCAGASARRPRRDLGWRHRIRGGGRAAAGRADGPSHRAAGHAPRRHRARGCVAARRSGAGALGAQRRLGWQGAAAMLADGQPPRLGPTTRSADRLAQPGQGTAADARRVATPAMRADRIKRASSDELERESPPGCAGERRKRNAPLVVCLNLGSDAGVHPHGKRLLKWIGVATNGVSG